MSAPWLESAVWGDIKQVLRDPGAVLARVRAAIEALDQPGELEARRADLEKRRAAKLAEKDRYVKLYAQGHLDEDELETYLADLRVQIDNLSLLIESVEADIASGREEPELAATTEAWLMTLHERIAQVEEAYQARRQLVRLLVERITIGRKGDGRPSTQITYRFGPPAGPDQGQEFAGGVRNSRMRRRVQPQL